MEYSAHISESVAEKNCKFCYKQKNNIEIVKQYGLFFILPNIYPYTKDHILLLPNRHIHSERDFSFKEQAELQKIHLLIINAYYRHYNSCFYFQRENTPGQTQWHWHRHYVPNELEIIPEASRIPFEGLTITID